MLPFDDSRGQYWFIRMVILLDHSDMTSNRGLRMELH